MYSACTLHVQYACALGDIQYTLQCRKLHLEKILYLLNINIIVVELERPWAVQEGCVG